MKPQDCYIALIAADGSRTTSYHRVWDKARFLQCKRDFHENHKDEDERRQVVEISRADYQSN